MQRVRRMLIGAWTAAILFSLPQVFIFRLAQPSPGFSQCAPIWSITTFRVIRALTAPNLDDVTRVLLETEYVQIVRLEKLYNLMHLLVLFWVPVLIIAVCYVVVLLLLKELADHEREKDEQHRLCKALLLTVIDRETQNGKSLERRSISSAGDVTRGEGDGEGDGQLVEADADSGCEAHSLDEGIRTIERGRQNHHSNNSTNALSLRTIGRARQVAARQAACILAAYLILWTPYNVMAAICAFFRPGDDEKNAWAATLTFLNALLVVNAIANPVIYGLTNPKNRTTQSRS